MTKDIRGKRSATKLRHKLQRSGQSVNETGLTNTPISTKVLSSLITSGLPRKRQRKQNTIDTNESLQPFKKRPIRLVLVIIKYIHKTMYLSTYQNVNGKKVSLKVYVVIWCYCFVLYTAVQSLNTVL